MSIDNTEMQSANDLIKEAVDKSHFKYYDYKNFRNIQEIGSGRFSKVFRANWKNSEQFLVLKYFFNFNKATAKEIEREVITYNIYCIYYCI